MISVEGEQEKHALQGVHTLFEVRPSGVTWSPNEKHVTKLVFIGKGLDRDQLLNSFVKECMKK